MSNVQFQPHRNKYSLTNVVSGFIACRVKISFLFCKEQTGQTKKFCGQNVGLLQVTNLVVRRVTIGILRVTIAKHFVLFCHHYTKITFLIEKKKT